MLYLAATPYSASTALVAVREERRVKAASAATPTTAAQGQEGLARATASADGDRPQQEDASGAEGTSPSS